jgi:glycerol-3-phosphate dehydrogenase (NAD(P)+)
MRVTVLGAGYMGSAMATVAAMRGHEVSLWGTWLDDDMIAPCEAGKEHPRLRLVLDPKMKLFRAPALEGALTGAELVVHAVNSDGAVPVMTKAAPFLPDVPVLSVSKGFLESRAGKMDRIDLVVSEAVGRHVRFVHAAGPAKAIEIARNVLTWMTFAGADAAMCAEAMGGDRLFIETTDDIAGAEMCSALKNAYATGLGLWDGFIGKDAHNARAACFTQAVVEMRKLVVASGGREATVHGSPGVGDLHVTAAGGRNRGFGERVGTGRPAAEVAAEMKAAGELTEGYPAIKTAWRFAKERGVTDLPFLEALHRIVWEGAAVAEVLPRMRLSVAGP